MADKPGKKALDFLKEARDELNVRLHLASMDARDAFHELEPRFEELKKRLEPAGKAAYDFVDVTTDVLYEQVRDGYAEIDRRLKERHAAEAEE